MIFGLYFLAVVSFAWCILTMYTAYGLFDTVKVSDPDRNVSIATMVMSLVGCTAFLFYVYFQPDSAFRVGRGFQWYDALIMFFLLACGIMSITTASLLLNYATTTTTQKNVCIATIVMSLILLLQYLTLLITESQVPEWCRQLTKIQNEKYRQMKMERELGAEDYYPSRASQQQQPPPQQIVVIPGGYPMATTSSKPKSSSI